MKNNQPQISVCIPAHNEALTIESIIENVRRVSNVTIREILVCANGCTDETVDIVKSMAKQNDTIRLLVEAKASKINAWNQLVEEACSEVLVFLDADITFEPDSVISLVNALNDSNLLVASGVRVLDRAKLTLERRFTGFILHPLSQDYVYGGYYAVRKPSLLAYFHSIGMSQMPNSISEDIFLTIAIPLKRIAIISQAIAYFTPPSAKELIRFLARGKAQLIDMQRRFPDLYDRFRSERLWDKNQLRVYIQKLANPKTKLNVTKGTLSALGKRVFIFVVKKQLDSYVELLLSQPREDAMARLTRSETSRISKS